MIVAVAAAIVSTPALADTGPAVELADGAPACVSAGNVRDAIAEHAVDLGAGARIDIELADGGVRLRVSTADLSLTHVIADTSCEVLPDVIAAFVATAFGTGPAVPLEAEPPRWPQVVAAARAEIAKQRPRFDELGASLHARFDAREGLVLLLAGPSAACAARAAVGRTPDVLSTVSAATDALEQIERCESADRGGRTVAERAEILYEWENKHLRRGFFRAHPNAVTAGILGPAVTGVALGLKDELSGGARLGLGIGGGLWMLGGGLAIFHRDEPHEIVVADTTYYGGLAAMSFGLASDPDLATSQTIAGIAYATTAAISIADYAVGGGVGRSELTRDTERIDTESERARLTESELSEMEARFSRRVSPKATLAKLAPIWAGAAINLGAAVLQDDGLREQIHLSAALSMVLISAAQWSIDSPARRFHRGERPVSATVVPTGAGLGIAGAF